MTLVSGKQIFRVRRLMFTLRRNEDGATAVEFGLISVPFFAMLFGVMSACQLFFWMYTMENAVWSAARDLRTGAFQTNAASSRYAGLTGDALKTEFKKAICEKAVIYADCMAHSSVLVEAVSSFSTLVAPNCIASGGGNSMVSDTSAMAAFNAGAASSVVMVTLCHSWSFGAKLTFLPMVKTLSDGGILIQASAAFRTEPYN